MKVAILGAPGSGKTEVGKRIAARLNRDAKEAAIASSGSEPIRRWKLIDDYVKDLSKRTGRRYGSEGDIPHNAQVMTERWTREAEALHQGFHTVTCGSIYETILYTAFTRLTPPTDEQEMMAWSQEAQVAMQFLNLMEQMTFNYDVLLYLPLGDHNHTMGWSRVIDAKLPEVLEGCFRYAVPLNESTLRQKVTHGLKVIRFIRDQADAVEAEATSDEQPGV